MATSSIAHGKTVAFTAWATLPDSSVRRLSMLARSQQHALAIAYSVCPNASGISVRRDDGNPPRDALLQLSRRSEDRP